MNPILATLFLVPLAAPADPDARGPSLCFGDFDADGLDDVFVARAEGGDRLLRNLGGGAFEDVTQLAGLPEGLRTDAGLWQDVDADGDLDLLTIARDAPARLWTNDGRGLFAEATSNAGLDSAPADLRARFVDVDGDGLADLHRTTPGGDRLFQNLGGGVFGELRLAGAPGSSLPAGSGPGLGVECTKAVADQAAPGSCIPASSVPMLGHLYPVSADWYVDPSGSVGIGTTAPAFRLDVAGDLRATGQLVSTSVGGPPLAVGSDEKVIDLNADLLDGLDASAFSQLGQSIETAELGDGAVATAKLADQSVTGDKLAAGAVGASHLAGGAVTSAAIAAGAVDTGELAIDAVTSSRIAPEAVTTADIKNGSVTAPKLAAGSVTTSTIADNEVRTADLRDNSVTGAKLAPDAVDGSHVDDGSLTGDDLDYFSVPYSKLESPLQGTTSGAILWVQNDITTAQGSCIYATTASSGDPAIEAIALDTGSGVTYGVKGLAGSQYGFGLWGRSNHSSGVTTGVKGEVFSSLGAGVEGENLSASGGAVGVLGTVGADSGRAVYGRHESTSGGGQGVRGWTNSPNGYGVYSSGDFAATGVKSFVQPHPTDPARELRFACLEGNEAGTYFRGSVRLVDGRAEIEVPEDFRLVSEAEGLTCQLTAVGAPALCWVESVDLERVIVRGNVDVELHYLINGVRRGHAGFRTVGPNRSFVPERAGVPYGNQYPPAFRRILVENGTLHPDYTPNEATADRLGWTLRDADARGE